MKSKLLTLLLLASASYSQNQANAHDSVNKRHFVSTSFWSIANLFPDPADFYELNYGYRLTVKDALIVNATTWKYPEPLGIPLTSEKKYKHIEDYPGYVRAFGLGFVYQRFLWGKLFLTLHTNVFIQNFYDEQSELIQSGFQLYTQARLGYRFEFFSDRLFLEPAVSFNYWPINTNLPDAFQRIENSWPNYFLFEPHLNFGISF